MSKVFAWTVLGCAVLFVIWLAVADQSAVDKCEMRFSHDTCMNLLR